jgi:1-deoxy-D-xylulose-5-phosphate reductoisomerase
MRTPIAHAMGFPERIESGVSALDMFKVAHLDFEEPDFKKFPCLKLAYQALAAGGNMPAVLNAANEIAVESFLKRRMPFTAIPAMIAHAMETVRQEEMVTLDDVLKTDTLARDVARNWLANLQ